MKVRCYTMKVSCNVMGHAVSDWEHSRDKADVIQRTEKMVDDAGHQNLATEVAASWYMCEKCGRQMEEKDNFCRDCGDKS